MDDEFFGGNQPYDNDDTAENENRDNDAEHEETENQYGQDLNNGYDDVVRTEPDNNDSNSANTEINNGLNRSYDYGAPAGDINGENQYRPYTQQYGAPYNNGNPYGGYQNGGNPPVSPKKNNGGMKVFVIVIIAIVALALGLIIGIFTHNSGSSSRNPGNVPESQTGTTSKVNTDDVGDISASSSSLGAGEASEVAKIAKQFNVGILIYKNNSLYTEGSGVIIKENDTHKYTYIITCAHVVNYQGVAVSVLMEDGTEYPADVVGLDTRTDLAVVRIEASGLTCAEIADSDELIVGQTVYAVGNPGGSEFFGSVTNGIISAIDRPISSTTGYEMECIQHTAAINPGNSGGALVNGEGKLIGINSMKIASTEYEGMGFSVPSAVVVKVFNSIIENGYVAGRAKLGIMYSVPSAYSQTYAMYVQMKGLPSGTIVIAEVNKDSELAAEDVMEGDMITKVNGKDMSDTNMLADMIEDMSVGDAITLTIVRVNTNNWTQTERNITVHLIEDKGTVAEEPEAEEPANPFGGSDGNNSYQDWYEFFREQYGF